MKCVCLYAQEFTNFRLAELESICDLLKIDIKIHKEIYNDQRPYLIIDVENDEDVKRILSRSVLMKSISELFVQSESFDAITTQNTEWKERFKKLFTERKETFKFEVEVYNKRITLNDKVYYIEEIQKYIAIPGDVNLKKADLNFSLLLDFENSGQLTQLFFGRLIGNSQRNSIFKYTLKTRYFIGNTSMDPQLSMVMANQAQVRKGSFCYDPFVGTGSIIVACSHFGAMCGGNDIDYNIIYGRGKSSRAGNKNYRAKDEIIRTNFENYDLLPFYWDIMAADATHAPFRTKEIFDAIVTDPPYGIREGGRKLGSKKDTTWDIPEEVRDEHIPAKKLHTLSKIILDLLAFALQYLVVGGRLVYWLPVYKPTYSEEAIPKHPAFRLVSNCEQNLTKTVSRRLITMVKTKRLEECSDDVILHNSEDWIQQQNDFRDNYFAGKKLDEKPHQTES
ncbi:tRNA (guanine(10)-N2)-methyltransferase homolog [Clytia hemisphaerica]